MCVSVYIYMYVYIYTDIKCALSNFPNTQIYI